MGCCFRKVSVAAVVALIVVTAFLIVNTIKITIFSRKREIEIMRLVGASNINIKIPFIIEGLILGILGSIIPIITTCYGYTTLYDKFDGKLFTDIIKLIEPTPFIYYVSLILVVIGMVVGMFGSLRAVKKYLKIWFIHIFFLYFIKLNGDIMEFKIGDIVTRNSYNNDTLFRITKINNIKINCDIIKLEWFNEN